MVGYGKEKALDTGRDHQNPCCYCEGRASLTRLLQPSNVTHIKHSVCKWKSSILQLIINSYRIYADLSLSFGMSNLIFHSQFCLYKKYSTERENSRIHLQKQHNVSSPGLVNRYHLLTQWQIQEHRQKEKLVHLCSTVLSALETDSGIRASELELLKQSSPTGQLNVFQVLTTCLRGCRQSPFTGSSHSCRPKAFSTPLLGSLILNSLSTYNCPTHMTGAPHCSFLHQTLTVPPGTTKALLQGAPNLWCALLSILQTGANSPLSFLVQSPNQKTKKKYVWFVFLS